MSKSEASHFFLIDFFEKYPYPLKEKFASSRGEGDQAIKQSATLHFRSQMPVTAINYSYPKIKNKLFVSERNIDIQY